MSNLILLETDDDTLWWSLQQLLRSTTLQPAFVHECVAIGLVEVAGGEAEWRFDVVSRERLQRAWRMHRDLDLQLAALPLLLELLDEVELLRAEVLQLRARLQHWERHGD